MDIVGKSFKFTLATMGMLAGGGAVEVPAGETVRVVAFNTADRELVNVRWRWQILTMFAEDVRSRAERVLD
jgi:hypothetical protein